MADSKISALSAVASATATQEVPVNDGGTTKKATWAQVKTFIANAFAMAAGSASAGTWPTLASGTLLTTAEDGAIEQDGNAWYLTADAGNRGVVPNYHIIRQDAGRTLTSTTSAQKLFDSVTNGTLTLETGCYLFECMISLSSMSATSGNAQFQLLGAGTATVGSVLYVATGVDNAVNASAAGGASGSNASSSAASVLAATTGTGLQLLVKGTFEVTVAGTIIPSIALVTAAAATMAAGSYFLCHRIGSTTLTNVGQWS